eukprot:TRINITY_DN13839_c0_g2_i2.p1 TRINITY_DN13839_c0_g2~~TRINITY_DN13839_c0_g2_i2.p1  ORF type:complete len:100 (+),score=10.19 TRINITY_DN13839_c0_g2_i2:205-504(+)
MEYFGRFYRKLCELDAVKKESHLFSQSLKDLAVHLNLCNKTVDPTPSDTSTLKFYPTITSSSTKEPVLTTTHTKMPVIPLHKKQSHRKRYLKIQRRMIN